VAVILVIVLAVSWLSPDPVATPPAEIEERAAAVVDERLEEVLSAPPASALAYQAILPSLVVVHADPGSGPARPAAGSGVVVSEQGTILTARHVVAGAEHVEVTFADGTEASAEVVAEEPSNDIAVLAPSRAPEVVVPAVLGGGVEVGDVAFAVGHPLGLVASLSAGVISGLDRSVPVDGGTVLEGLIQFDAAVNPGSSGGPLLDRDGQVVGIVTALANPNEHGLFTGIGFAVPIGAASSTAGGPDL
jgi:S1-C subfamily serine protease